MAGLIAAAAIGRNRYPAKGIIECNKETPRKAASAMLRQRLDEPNSGEKTATDKKTGNMTLAGNLKRRYGKTDFSIEN